MFHSMISDDLGIVKYHPRSVRLNFDLKTSWKFIDLSIAVTELVKVPMCTGEMESEYATLKKLSFGFLNCAAAGLIAESMVLSL